MLLLLQLRFLFNNIPSSLSLNNQILFKRLFGYGLAMQLQPSPHMRDLYIVSLAVQNIVEPCTYISIRSLSENSFAPNSRFIQPADRLISSNDLRILFKRHINLYKRYVIWRLKYKLYLIRPKFNRGSNQLFGMFRYSGFYGSGLYDHYKHYQKMKQVRVFSSRDHFYLTNRRNSLMGRGSALRYLQLNSLSILPLILGLTQIGCIGLDINLTIQYYVNIIIRAILVGVSLSKIFSGIRYDLLFGLSTDTRIFGGRAYSLQHSTRPGFNADSAKIYFNEFMNRAVSSAQRLGVNQYLTDHRLYYSKLRLSRNILLLGGMLSDQFSSEFNNFKLFGSRVILFGRILDRFSGVHLYNNIGGDSTLLFLYYLESSSINLQASIINTLKLPNYITNNSLFSIPSCIIRHGLIRKNI
jgi:hypothetical protein